MALAWAVTLCATGCAAQGEAAGRATTVAGIEAAFSTFERLAVRTFSAEADCDRITYARGSYALTGEGLPCSVYPRRTTDPGVIDPVTRADIDAVRATSATARSLTYASMTYDVGGHVTGGEFGLVGCSLFVYQPGYGRLPDADSYVPIEIDPDWYLLSC